MKIAVMNATKVSIAPVDLAAKQYPEAQIFHFMDEGMSWLGKQEGRISDQNINRMIRLIRSAEEMGADGILLSCTIFSPYVERIQECTELPVVAADIGVFEKAAQLYQRIGAVVSFAPTLESVAWVVDRCRQRVRPDFDVEIHFAEGAMEAAAEGDEQRHNQLVYEAAASFRDKEAIVLSQMSQVRALSMFEKYPIPVMTSPSVSLGMLIDRIKQSTDEKRNVI
ncbi:MAG: hypothetical protein J5483_03885 [Lachnospiraceae bacterium]|nr:hypothetical protein [Lachnospiraceae bacterium]